MKYLDLLFSPKTESAPNFGEIFWCDHPVYDECTLYRKDGKGLAVIQQRYNPRQKTTKWTHIDDELVDKIYKHHNFEWFFDRYSAPINENACYPTVTLRQIMHALRMPPLPRQDWETVFDHKPF